MVDRTDLIRRAREAQRSLAASLIAVEGHLTRPYPDAPDQSPWSRFITPMQRQVNDVIGELVAALDTPAPEPAHAAVDAYAAVVDLLARRGVETEIPHEWGLLCGVLAAGLDSIASRLTGGTTT